jgi:hypothetical protein
MNRFGGLLFLLSLSSITNLALTQSPDVMSTPKPSFTLAIGIPSIIRPTAEILLETKYTNTTDHDLGMSGGCPLRESYDVIVRDSAGARIQKSPAGQTAKCERLATLDVSVPLHPGETITDELMLDKLFVLSKPGEYTIEVASYDNDSKSTVKSNAVQFRVPQSVPRLTNTSAAFSVSISSSEAVVPTVDRYDEPDALSNETLQNLPIVQSNTATVTVARGSNHEH